MKRTIAALCIIIMVFVTGACSEKDTDYSNRTLTGKVTSIEGTKITMQLGELSEQEKPQEEMKQPGGVSKGSGEQDSSEKSSRETPPEKHRPEKCRRRRTTGK